ncbi:MAG: ABC transporter ATP-binding protein [Pseudotabrizicola sp.]|uniref:ABC transporter ATP-binding protein n=1 Tax=Pseudotabrizicola sp. TaxID=2939647 RepID=UPI00271BBE43|nr:ABC transporter ATP-binding protein [Pseudotabrizicola sp.]MDO8881963.1 ABC transporter ATP-binding protein [Pseudotabrizicola sp.]MDP2082700.1 ABC transporter ATP-binding protein [Pseudotabrizicola sp.]MDZ7576327.1 ABC transporter ATP-binding protein [Pseudotabrizicola sp.]
MIEFRDVHKYYGDYHALRGINGTIRAGEFFSLLGPSGCGKTTLLRTIAGFEGIDKGAVLIDAKDMAKVPANNRPTNMVFQSYAIFPHMSVGENVGFGLRRDPRSKADKAKAVEEALEMVGLKGYGARAAHALSGGQRQRVALARALILKPKVLLLDEPLSALDKKMREHMQVELIKLQRQVGITFVLVTHDQEEALVMSDRIAVMFEGEIAQLADPETLYRRPNSKKVADFIGTMNFIPAVVISETGGQIEVDAKGLGRAILEMDQCPAGQGDAPMVGLRPETLTLMYPGQTTTERTVDGVIDEVIYFGDMTYYDVYLGGTDVEVRLSMRNTPGRPILDVGTKVDVAWSPSALVLFR